MSKIGNLMNPYMFDSVKEAMDDIFEAIDVIVNVEKKNLLLVASAKKTRPIVLRNMQSKTFKNLYADVVLCGINPRVLRKVFKRLYPLTRNYTMYYSTDGQLLSIIRI